MEVPENASYCCYGKVILALLLGSLGNLFDVAHIIAEALSNSDADRNAGGNRFIVSMGPSHTSIQS